LQQWTNFCTNFSPKKWGEWGTCPPVEKIGGTPSPASRPHYTPVADGPARRAASRASCYSRQHAPLTGLIAPVQYAQRPGYVDIHASATSQNIDPTNIATADKLAGTSRGVDADFLPFLPPPLSRLPLLLHLCFPPHSSFLLPLNSARRSVKRCKLPLVPSEK